MSLPSGFTSYPSSAIWIECERCGEAEEFGDVDNDEQAAKWANEHECSEPDPPGYFDSRAEERIDALDRAELDR